MTSTVSSEVRASPDIGWFATYSFGGRIAGEVSTVDVAICSLVDVNGSTTLWKLPFTEFKSGAGHGAPGI
jgi:hypothetical protein